MMLSLALDSMMPEVMILSLTVPITDVTLMGAGMGVQGKEDAGDEPPFQVRLESSAEVIKHVRNDQVGIGKGQVSSAHGKSVILTV